jgi:hypothetical protein
MTEKFGERLKRVSKAQKESFVVSPDDYRIGEDGIYRSERDKEAGIWATAHSTFKELLSRPDVTKAVAMVGIPGAGKSTWLASNKEPGVVYFDATMARPKYRTRLVKIANSIGKPIEALVMKTKLDVCITRNASRTPDRVVPEFVLRNMHRNLSEEPVSRDEGFADIRRA